MTGERWCWHHHPDFAEERRRNASRAATLGNSKVGAEIRSTRLMIRELLEVTLSGNLDPLVRKRLAEVVQLVQSYCRLAELEIHAGERPKIGGVALPEDTGERIRDWVDGEEAKVGERKILSELVPAMEARGYDTGAVKAVLGG
jgi:hypothetical protein